MAKLTLFISFCSILVAFNCSRQDNRSFRGIGGDEREQSRSDPDSKPDDCVFKAIDDRDLKAFDRCLNAGNVNSHGHVHGETPLTYLLRKHANEEFHEKRKFLDVAFRNGADARTPNSMGVPPICIRQYESGAGFPTISYLLSKGAGINDRDAEGNTYLFDILIPEAEPDNLPFYASIAFFVRHGGDLNAVNKRGNSVLMNMLSNTLRAEHDFSEIIIYLHRSGSNLNIRNAKGETALSISKNDLFASKMQTNTLVRLGAK